MTGDDKLAADIGALAVTARRLLPLVSELSRAAYAVRWAVDDGAERAHLSDEVWDYRNERLGLEVLDEVLLRMGSELHAAAGESPAHPPTWFTVAQAARRMRRSQR